LQLLNLLTDCELAATAIPKSATPAPITRRMAAKSVISVMAKASPTRLPGTPSSP